MNYPPQGPSQGQYQGGAYMPPPEPYGGPQHGRSGIPKVMGILMIIFASLGLLFTLIGLGSNSNEEAFRQFGGEFDSMITFQKVSGIIGLGLGVLHLLAGIRSVGYKSNGPKLAITYAIISIVYGVVSLILVYAWMMPKLPEELKGAFSIGFVIGGMIGMAWPIIVWALMSRPAAKAACTN